MGVFQWRDQRKPSGGVRRWPFKVKRKHAMGREFLPTFLGADDERRRIRVRGGGVKVRVRRAAYCIVSDPGTGRSVKARIIRVLETPANREFARRNIIVRGAIVETSAGKARVTSRPNQDGVVNAVLVEGGRLEPGEGEEGQESSSVAG